MPTDFNIPLHPLEHDGWKSDYVLSNRSVNEFRELHRAVSASLGRLDNEIARVENVLNSEIARLKNILGELHHERSLYVLRIDKIDSALAPHKKMPVEILSQVFNFTVDEMICLHLAPERISTDDMPSPSRVCSRWRQVALTTQKLWNSIDMICTIDEREYTDEIIRIAHTIISRGSSFISLRLFDKRDRSLANHPSIPALINTVSLAKHLELSASTCQLFRDIFAISPPSFPVLEQLDFFDWGYQAIEVEKCSIFNNAPRLVKFSIAKHDEFTLLSKPLISQPSSELPWGQLQVIKILNPMTLFATHSILSWCSRLIHCTFNISGNGDQTPSPPLFSCGSIPLPNLISLTFTFSERRVPETEAVLKPLVLPSLNILSTQPHAGDIWYTSIKYLIVRSRCSLKRFNCLVPSVLEVPADALDLFYDLSPTLTLFRMDYMAISIEMLALISRGALFPRLMSLRCRIKKSPAALEGLIDLIRHRCLNVATEGASRILHLEVRGAGGWADRDDRFNLLVAEIAKNGCRVVLSKKW